MNSLKGILDWYFSSYHRLSGFEAFHDSLIGIKETLCKTHDKDYFWWQHKPVGAQSVLGVQSYALSYWRKLFRRNSVLIVKHRSTGHLLCSYVPANSKAADKRLFLPASLLIWEETRISKHLKKITESLWCSCHRIELNGRASSFTAAKRLLRVWKKSFRSHLSRLLLQIESIFGRDKFKLSLKGMKI